MLKILCVLLWASFILAGLNLVYFVYLSHTYIGGGVLYYLLNFWQAFIFGILFWMLALYSFHKRKFGDDFVIILFAPFIGILNFIYPLPSIQQLAEQHWLLLLWLIIDFILWALVILFSLAVWWKERSNNQSFIQAVVADENASGIQEDLLLPDRQSRILLSVKAGIMLSPLLFLASFINLNPFIFLYETLNPGTPINLTSSFIYFVKTISVFAMLLFVGITFFSTKKLSQSHLVRILYKFPLWYFILLLPLILLFSVILLGPFFGARGEGAGFAAIYAFWYLWFIAVSGVTALISGVVIWLWLRRTYALCVVLYLLVFVCLTFYVFTRVISHGCYVKDFSCFVGNGATQSEKMNADNCLNAENSSQCYAVLAERTGQPEICDRVSPEEQKDAQFYCKNSALTKKAIKTQNPAICEQVYERDYSKDSPEKSRCYAFAYEEIAFAKGDVLYCDKIAKVYSSSTSLYKVTDVSSCYVRVVVKNKDESLCDNLPIEKEKNQCRSFAKTCRIASEGEALGGPSGRAILYCDNASQ